MLALLQSNDPIGALITFMLMVFLFFGAILFISGWYTVKGYRGWSQSTRQSQGEQDKFYQRENRKADAQEQALRHNMERRNRQHQLMKDRHDDFMMM